LQQITSQLPCATLAAVTDAASRPDIRTGARLVGGDGRLVGIVDAVFVDYLLVRTASLLPIDLYVPRPEVSGAGDVLRVEATRRQAYERWHRPLKRAPHEER
jgi:hypothetical protein